MLTALENTEARNWDEAIQIASQWPSALPGNIEVRPIEEMLRLAGRYRPTL